MTIHTAHFRNDTARACHDIEGERGCRMSSHAIRIGTGRPAGGRCPPGERRSVPAAQNSARLPVPRRLPNEFYPTPPAATRALLSVERFDGSIWEPACGEGAIARELAAAGHQVISTDLHSYGFGATGVDFLREVAPRATHIVTNPPYGNGLADAFLLKALALTQSTGGKVALLLNLASLCHPSRTALWRRHPPARLYAIDGIVCWPVHRYGPAPAAFTRHRYVWAVWSPDHCGPTSFDWLSAREFP